MLYCVILYYVYVCPAPRGEAGLGGPQESVRRATNQTDEAQANVVYVLSSLLFF